ncbi:MAG: lysophospholipid acyltransferase family protein [Anaerolineae bacterium]
MTVPLIDQLAGLGLHIYALLVSRTSRYVVRGKEHFEEAWAEGQPVIWAAWHGMTMMGLGYFFRFYGDHHYVEIVSADRRGRRVATWFRLLGIEPYFVDHYSTSLSQARGVVHFVRAVKRGASTFINPDGPDGPPYVVKPGVVYIAQKTGARLLPSAAFTATKYTLKRWDHYSAPLPFSRIAIVVGEPVPAPSDGNPEVIAQALAEAMHQATADAERLYYSRI